MKYVITDHNKCAMGSGTFHRDLATSVTGKVIGAGHFRITNGKVEVFDGSAGFGMDAKPEDAETLNSFLGLS